MANYRIAKRYAKGLYDYSESVNKTQEVYTEMQNLLAIIKENKDLVVFFKSPILDFRKKQTVAAEIFKPFSETTKRFIQLVITHKRESNLQEIATHFLTLTDVKNGIQKAVFTSATALDENTIQQILEKSGLIKDKNAVNLEQKIDASLIGGYVLRVADQQLDTSIKAQLTKLRNNFDENLFIPKI